MYFLEQEMPSNTDIFPQTNHLLLIKFPIFIMYVIWSWVVILENLIYSLLK
jgi:hypothetical protein